LTVDEFNIDWYLTHTVIFVFLYREQYITDLIQYFENEKQVS